MPFKRFGGAVCTSVPVQNFNGWWAFPSFSAAQSVIRFYRGSPRPNASEGEPCTRYQQYAAFYIVLYVRVPVDNARALVQVNGTSIFCARSLHVRDRSIYQVRAIPCVHQDFALRYMTRMHSIPHSVYHPPTEYTTRVAINLKSQRTTRVITRGMVYTTPPEVMPQNHYGTHKLSPRVKTCRD